MGEYPSDGTATGFGGDLHCSHDNDVCHDFLDDVVFSHNGGNRDTGRWRIIHFDSPGGRGPRAKSAVSDCLVVVAAVPSSQLILAIFLRQLSLGQSAGLHRRGNASVKAKFHHASWFEAGSKLVADRFEPDRVMEFGF